MTQKIDINMQWFREVEREKSKILSSDKEPFEILVKVFELCQDEFDVTQIKVKLPKLYEILQEFCIQNPVNDEELRVTSRSLAEFFYAHKNEIRAVDVQLFYALLNFMNWLKSKNVHIDIIYRT